MRIEFFFKEFIFLCDNERKINIHTHTWSTVRIRVYTTNRWDIYLLLILDDIGVTKPVALLIYSGSPMCPVTMHGCVK